MAGKTYKPNENIGYDDLSYLRVKILKVFKNTRRFLRNDFSFYSN